MEINYILHILYVQKISVFIYSVRFRSYLDWTTFIIQNQLQLWPRVSFSFTRQYNTFTRVLHHSSFCIIKRGRFKYNNISFCIYCLISIRRSSNEKLSHYCRRFDCKNLLLVFEHFVKETKCTRMQIMLIQNLYFPEDTP